MSHPCPECNGTGVAYYATTHPVVCANCEGKNTIWKRITPAFDAWWLAEGSKAVVGLDHADTSIIAWEAGESNILKGVWRLMVDLRSRCTAPDADLFEQEVWLRLCGIAGVDPSSVRIPDDYPVPSSDTRAALEQSTHKSKVERGPLGQNTAPRVRILDHSEAHNEQGHVYAVQQNGITIVELDSGALWPVDSSQLETDTLGNRQEPHDSR